MFRTAAEPACEPGLGCLYSVVIKPSQDLLYLIKDVQQCLTCLGRERVRSAVINRSRLCFTQNWVTVAHICVESKYRVVCVTTGNELAARRDHGRVYFGPRLTPYLHTHSQSLLRPPPYIPSILIFLFNSSLTTKFVFLLIMSAGTGLLIPSWFSLL